MRQARSGTGCSQRPSPAAGSRPMACICVATHSAAISCARVPVPRPSSRSEERKRVPAERAAGRTAASPAAASLRERGCGGDRGSCGGGTEKEHGGVHASPYTDGAWAGRCTADAPARVSQLGRARHRAGSGQDRTHRHHPADPGQFRGQPQQEQRRERPEQPLPQARGTRQAPRPASQPAPQAEGRRGVAGQHEEDPGGSRPDGDGDPHDGECEEHGGQRKSEDRRDAQRLGEPRAPPLHRDGVPRQHRRQRHPGPRQEQHPDLHQGRPRRGDHPCAQRAWARSDDRHLSADDRPVGDPGRSRAGHHEVAAQARLGADHHVVRADARDPRHVAVDLDVRSGGVQVAGHVAQVHDPPAPEDGVPSHPRPAGERDLPAGDEEPVADPALHDHLPAQGTHVVPDHPADVHEEPGGVHVAGHGPVEPGLEASHGEVSLHAPVDVDGRAGQVLIPGQPPLLHVQFPVLLRQGRQRQAERQGRHHPRRARGPHSPIALSTSRLGRRPSNS